MLKKKNLTINLGNIYITLGKENQVKQEIWNLKEKIIYLMPLKLNILYGKDTVE